MAHTAHKDEESMKEHFDPPEVLESKIDRLTQLVRQSKHIVVFTGAGISTSAGIPDFRGPTGKWTRQAQGLEPIAGTPVVKALPTKTHMSLVQLQRLGYLKYLISQNCDGLHRRSGMPASSISELHGNGNIEICEDCGRRYFRDFPCQRRLRTFDHFTGRFCPHCDGRLLNSTIDFGQGLPSEPLRKAKAQSKQADLHIVLGSSLTVSPACDMPALSARKGGKLVIVNLQKTGLSEAADTHIFAPTDKVMEALMGKLGIEIPPFRLQRRIILSQEDENVVAKSVDVHDPETEVAVVCGVDWHGQHLEISGSDRINALWKNQHYTCPKAELDLQALAPTFHWVGHYQEPPVTINASVSGGPADIRLSYDPLAGSWAVDSIAPFDGRLHAEPDVDIEYGQTHRQYVIDKRRGTYGDSTEQRVADEFRVAREKASSWADQEAQKCAKEDSVRRRAGAEFY